MVVGNIGHFDNEIGMAGLARVPGIERINTNQVIAQIGLYGHTDIYEKRVHTLPKHLDEEIRGSTSTRSAKLAELAREQAAYIEVPVEGPYKPVRYRYRRSRHGA